MTISKLSPGSAETPKTSSNSKMMQWALGQGTGRSGLAQPLTQEAVGTPCPELRGKGCFWLSNERDFTWNSRFFWQQTASIINLWRGWFLIIDEMSQCSGLSSAGKVWQTNPKRKGMTTGTIHLWVTYYPNKSGTCPYGYFTRPKDLLSAKCCCPVKKMKLGGRKSDFFGGQGTIF